MEKKRKGPVKVTAGAPATVAKPKKKRYYPSKPKVKIQANKSKELVEAAITTTQPEPAVFVWTEEAPKKKTWIQKVLEWLPLIERK